MDPHVIVIGGGFAGLDAARALKAEAGPGHAHRPAQPPRVSAAAVPGGDGGAVTRRHRVADSVDSAQTGERPRAARRRAARSTPPHEPLHLDGGDTLSYDYLIARAGGDALVLWPSRVGRGSARPEDARRCPGDPRRRCCSRSSRPSGPATPPSKRHFLTFAIIGGGPTGVELAGALAEIARHTLRREFDTIEPESARIVLLEGGPTILPAFPPSLRDSARTALRRLGVEVWENAVVTNVEHDALTVGPHSTSSGQADRVTAHTILWAAGVAASPLGASLGVELDRAEPHRRVAGPVGAGTSRRSSSPGISLLAAPGRQAAAGRGAGGQAAGAACREERAAPDRRIGDDLLPLPRPGQHGDDRPRRTRSPISAGRACPAFSAG